MATETTPTSPIARVKAAHQDKNALIEKIKTLATEALWVDRLNDDTSWRGISNAKLLRLHSVLSEVTQKFGTREKLIDAIATTEGRAKDTDYKKHFAAWPLPRLLDAHKAAEKRKKQAERAASGAKAKARAKAKAKTSAKTAVKS